MPRKFLLPRPMASAVRRQHPFWDYVSLDALAATLLVLVAVSSPLGFVDHWLHRTLLELTAKREPPTSVVVVSVDASEAHRSDCFTSVVKAAHVGGARFSLLLPPLDKLCGPQGDAVVSNLAVLPAPTLLRDSDGRILGFYAPPADFHRLKPLGFARTRWVSPRPWESVPRISLTDLREGRVEADVLKRRIALLSLDDALIDGNHVNALGPLSARVAASMAGAIEEGPREPAVFWQVALVAVGTGAFLLFLGRHRRWRSLGHLPPLAIYLLLVSASLFGARGIGVLWPLPSLGLALLVHTATLHAPRVFAQRRARSSAEKLLAGATLGTPGTHALPDAEFFERLADRIAQSHPADAVLVAELPAFSWRLKVWPHGDLNESIIRERRRDVRRTPYVDETGARAIKVLHDYVVMAGVPMLFIPLEAAGELEGYIFLIGKNAADSYAKKPELSLRLGNDVAELIRKRRIERGRQDDWRRTAGLLVGEAGADSHNLITQARTALDELQLFSSVLRSAPVGLMYADAFGDIRIAGRAVLDLLRYCELELPEAGPSGMIPVRTLPLTRLLGAVSSRLSLPAPSLSEVADKGWLVELPTLGRDGSQRALVISVKAMESEEQGGAGFVGSVVEVQRHQVSEEGDNVQAFPERRDVLTVFSMAQVITDVVDTVARRNQGNIRLQAPRVVAQVIGHRPELSATLEQFLVEAAAREGSGTGPVVTIRERHLRVEVSLLDLRLDVPTAALKRTLTAPADPPAGLASLGALAAAVENSHGRLTLRSEEGWGTSLIISLLRAHPKISTEPGADIVPLRKPKVQH
ncbi:MAG: hypothetical protein SFV15_24730 [Polyangiaceae bacterium]|nr:hypothetical protein [Polyangiaceae bacterium]